jgi:cobaltochelatase CobN
MYRVANFGATGHAPRRCSGRPEHQSKGGGTEARRLFFLLLFVLGFSVPSFAQSVHLAYLYSDGNTPGTLKAYKALLGERPDLRGRVTLSFLTESIFADVAPRDMTRANVLVFDIMNQQMLERFNATHNVDLIAAVKQRGTVLAVGAGLQPKEYYTDQGAVWDDRARAFWTHSGFANQLALMKLALSRAGIQGFTIPEPQPSIEFGFYYPDGQTGQVFASWDEFTKWRQAHGRLRPGAPRIAVGFYKASYYTGETELIDAVIAEVERRGAEAIPLFGYPGAVAFEKLLTGEDGQPRVDAALAFLFRFANFDASLSLEKLDVPVINLISLYGRSEKEWRASPQGLSMFEGTFQVAVPELAGLIAPTVIGSQEKVKDPDTGLTVPVRKPIGSQISIAVNRALKYTILRSTPNRDKRVAIMFYNYPPGKANIGASYLNVADSLANMLQRLATEGYDVGSADLSSAAVLRDITTKARNVGGYAPGELQEMLAQGNAVRVGFSEYRQWLNGYAPPLRAKILKDWGDPRQSKLMASADGEEGPGFVIPVVKYGNVVLLPQPARGNGEDLDKLYHAKDLAPHHQYVAAYAWLRNSFKAAAVVHLGTHGTLEWLDGKDLGMSDEDAPDALIADVPNIYLYNVDVVGEGLVARRRSHAALVDHMVPPFKKGGLLPDLAELGETINDFDNNLHKNPELAKANAERIREQVTRLGLAKDLSLDPKVEIDDETVHRIQDHLVTLRGENIPYGLHAFGRTPEKEMRDSTIDAIVSVDRSLLPKNAKILAADMEARIVASGRRELDNLTRALRGGFIPAGGGGEPIRNPDSYPTGKNFYGIDPDKVPKPASWELGVKLADQMLADHLKKHGRYPEKVSFVIWGDETMRHEGVVEAQIFHLLGTKPIWDARGKVTGVEVIPSAKLGRPRVDIVIACAAEGMFNNVTLLMDQAVQKVKALDEAENFVRRHYLATRAILVQRGYSEADADKRAGVRIFDEPPGIFNLNTSSIVAASGTWDTDTGMADDYLHKLGYAYGNGFWGEPMEDVFRLALAGTEKVVHSSSTMLYGTLDNDDFFMYMGGLAAAIRSIDGKSPELVVTNTRDPGRPEMTSIDKFIGTEFRSRYVNPTWIEGMKKEGYAGAGEMRSFVEYLWGWDATVPETVDAGMWQETFAVYVDDKHKLGMKEFFEQQSPFAYQDMTARMVETIRKGYWRPDAATESKLISEYVASVNAHGPSGAEFTSGNPRLSRYVMEEGRKAGVPVPSLQAFQRAMERATGAQMAAAAQAAEAFATQNDARSAARLAEVPAPTPPQTTPLPQPTAQELAAASQQVKGFLMEEQERQRATDNARPVIANIPDTWAALMAAVPLLALLILWRRRRRA